jgi:TatD DNase family protein
MWIDTHCHLDADEFDADRVVVVERARAAGVSMIVMPAGHIDDHVKAASVAGEFGFAYALGIHPLWLERSVEEDVDRLRALVPAALRDPRFVAIGEIGIDLAAGGPERQQWFYAEQLRIARLR